MTIESFNEHWTVRPKTSIFAELGGVTTGRTDITLPHDAQFETQRSAEASEGTNTGYHASGAFEYEKTFDVPQEFRTKRVTLELQGVYRDAMVFINGNYAAQRPFGYSTFYISLDAFLKYGEPNTIRIDARAHEDSRWYSGIGIHRDTRLHITDLAHITPTGIRISTPDVEPDQAVVLISSTVRNDGIGTETLVINSALRAADGSVVAQDTAPITLRAGGEGVVRQRLYVASPVLWNVDTPYLYEAITVLQRGEETIQEQTTPVGIRTIQVDPTNGLRINGTTTKLRGACVHSDNGILGAAAIARADERRVEILKSAGFNAVRSAHNPISQATLDACDRLGMLVMDETFDIWTEAKSSFDYSLSFPEWWERDVEAMVEKDYNHPSVIFYSIGNEIPETGSPLGSQWGRAMAEKVRQLDDTRLVTNAINGFVSSLTDVMKMMQQRGADGSSQGVNDLMGNAGDFMNRISASSMVSEKTAESFSVLDVAGINYGDARYKLDHGLFPNRVIVGTETFPTHIDVNWKLVESLPHVIGDFTWTGWDYLGETGIGRVVYTDVEAKPSLGAPFPWLTAWSGDIDITGHRRPVSYYRETVFGLRAEPYISVQRPENYGRPIFAGQWAWSDSISSWSWGSAGGAPVIVEVYSDADEVELQLNGRPVARKPVGEERSFEALFPLDYEPGELVAIAYKDGVETGRSQLCTATGEITVVAKADRGLIRADDKDLSFVDIELQDAYGNLFVGADQPLTVSVTGAGALRALGSGRPNPTELYSAITHTTFDGRLLAIVRPTSAGEITVEVSGEGIHPAIVKVTAE